jgi:hypothetical protein
VRPELGDRHAVGIDDVSGRGRREAVGAVEGDGARLDVEQGDAAVGVDGHVVVAARHRPDADLGRDAGEDLIALVEQIGDVRTPPRAFDDLGVDGLEAGKQRVDVADGGRHLAIGLGAQLLHRAGRGVERLGEVGGRGDRGASGGRIRGEVA